MHNHLGTTHAGVLKRGVVVVLGLLVLFVHFFSFGMHYTFGSSEDQLLIVRSVYAVFLMTMILLCLKRFNFMVFVISIIALIFPKILGLIMSERFAIYSPTIFSGNEHARAQWQFLVYSLILSIMLAGVSICFGKVFLSNQRR